MQKAACHYQCPIPMSFAAVAFICITLYYHFRLDYIHLVIYIFNQYFFPFISSLIWVENYKYLNIHTIARAWKWSKTIPWPETRTDGKNRWFKQNLPKGRFLCHVLSLFIRSLKGWHSIKIKQVLSRQSTWCAVKWIDLSSESNKWILLTLSREKYSSAPIH